MGAIYSFPVFDKVDKLTCQPLSPQLVNFAQHEE